MTILDETFTVLVGAGRLPEALSGTSLRDAGLDRAAALALFDSQVVSRHLDFAARRLRALGKGFYTIGSSGHEANAALGAVARLSDLLFLHYRSGALFVQRAKQCPEVDVIGDLVLSLLAAAAEPISGGRHKVFGSLRLNVPPQTSTIASHLPKAVGAAVSIGKAKKLALPSPLPYDAVVVCSFGDASVNHAAAQAAFNTAAWCVHRNIPVPVLFVCEDNGIGISVESPPGWVEGAFSARHGLVYVAADGVSLADTHAAAAEALAYVRATRRPVFLHLHTVRLLGHAGADVESVYRSIDAIQKSEGNDPLLHSARLLIEAGYADAPAVLGIYEAARQRVEAACQRHAGTAILATRAEIIAALLPRPRLVDTPRRPTEGERTGVFDAEWPLLARPQTLGRLLNWGLKDLLLTYPNLLIFGEDVAAKGGIYNVTSGLERRFGPARVFNTPLDETSILGAAIGMAHNGFLPIPEIQFLAYLHNAEDQLRGEAATLAYFSNGHLANPMVVRIPGLAYQKGFGGHFHNDNSLAVLRDIPGLVIACPSNGADAVRMLRHCVDLAHRHGRVCVFVEPIALYATKDLHETNDQLWQTLYPPPDTATSAEGPTVHGAGTDLAIVSYANGYFLARQAAQLLEVHHRIATRTVDLRWLAPFDVEAFFRTIRGVSCVLIVEECRRTGSVAEALLAAILEAYPEPRPRVACVAAADCFIPLGDAARAMLPQRDEIVSAARCLVEARAAGPSSLRSLPKLLSS